MKNTVSISRQSLRCYFKVFLFIFWSSFTPQIFSQDFPLKGQTWVFVNGPNEETHIVKSVSDFAPSSVIVAKFNEDATADIHYANLSGRFCRSTAEAIDTIISELRKNVLLHSKLFQASKRNFPDTAYSCDAELVRLAGMLRYNRYVVNGNEVKPNSNPSSWQWLFDPPECYATRPAREQDKQEKDLCENHWCVDPTPDPTIPFQETCNDTYTECHQVIEESALKTRASMRTFWNLHLFPNIILHPRHPATERIIKEISLSEQEAENFRQQAIENPNNQDLKIYLNPVMDDSASVYFSGQFLTPALNPYQIGSLSLDIQPEGEGASGYTHDPPMALRIASVDDWTGLQKALLLPFSRDENEKQFLENIDTRCPGWVTADRLIGQKAFEVKSGLDVTLPDVLPTETQDPSWKKVRQERVLVNGGFEVKTIVDDDRMITGQMALVKNLDFPYGDHFWKGCPDLPDTFFKLTKSQAARLLNFPVPTCNLSTLSISADFHRNLKSRFNSVDDAKEIEMANQRALEAEFQFDRTKNKERPADIICPDTPLDIIIREMQ